VTVTLDQQASNKVPGSSIFLWRSVTVTVTKTPTVTVTVTVTVDQEASNKVLVTFFLNFTLLRSKENKRERLINSISPDRIKRPELHSIRIFMNY
jgi:hypothetical protein